MREKDIAFFFETSAMNGQNVEMVISMISFPLTKLNWQAFREAGKMIYLKYMLTRSKTRGGTLDRNSLNMHEPRPQRVTITKATASPRKVDHSKCSC